MAATHLQAQRDLPYSPEDLCRLVGDVRGYPSFIPWIQSLRVLRETPLELGGWEGVAEAVVGWKAITERFATRVRAEPAKGEVDVSLVSGPFKTLKNQWRFAPLPGGTAQVSFLITYEFRNPILNALVGANRERAAQKIMQAFEAEAARRFGAQKP
jgi:coenzyme Q-binding protein COQ10